jgi:hypothetical protein
MSSVPVSRRPLSIRSRRSSGGNRPPSRSPASVEGVPQNTDSRACSGEPRRFWASATAWIDAASSGLRGSLTIRPRSTSLTSALKPPMRQAAQRVCREQAVAERRPIGANGVRQHTLSIDNDHLSPDAVANAAFSGATRTRSWRAEPRASTYVPFRARAHVPVPARAPVLERARNPRSARPRGRPTARRRRGRTRSARRPAVDRSGRGSAPRTAHRRRRQLPPTRMPGSSFEGPRFEGTPLRLHGARGGQRAGVVSPVHSR